MERLQTTLQYELAVNGLNFNNSHLGSLHSAYVRGEAPKVARRYHEAAAEFQKILNHRGIVGMDPIGALPHLQLGRVYVLANDSARAKAEEAVQLLLDAGAIVDAKDMHGMGW